MLETVKTYINKHQMIEKNDKILLAVSGGLLAPIVCHALYDYLAIRWLDRRNQLRTER